MSDDDLVNRFWDAILDRDNVDPEPFLAEGGEKIDAAVRVHRLFQEAAESWKEPKVPTRLGRFEVLSELGAGGLGRVYLAWDPDLCRHVAIKVIARDRWAINEARSIARLDHRSIVKVFEVGQDRLVMELLDGGTLQDKLEALRDTPLPDGEEGFLAPLRARLHCLVRIAEGLAYCHDRGILHRDVKPANVLFARQDEHPRLVDFGLAHLDELESLDITQNLVGSPAYLAPEQVEAGETGTDRRSDIFSFGVLAYELLTLHSPFRRDTRTETLRAISEARPTPPRKLNADIPRPVVNILEHCLEPSPNERYDTMHDVVRDLQDAIASRPISVGNRSPQHKFGLYIQRHRRVAGFAFAGVASAGAFGALLWLGSLHAARSEFAAELAVADAAIDELTTSAAMQSAGLDLYNAQGRAKGLDRSWLGRTLFLNCGPLVDAICERWSRHLSDRINALSDVQSKVLPPDIWRSLLHIDARLLPDAKWNRSLREGGALVLEGELAQRRDELILYRQGPSGFGPLLSDLIFEEVPFAPFPPIGFYRAELPGEWQSEFVLESPWSEMVRLKMPAHCLETSDWYAGEVGGMLVSKLIRWEQFQAYCDALGLKFQEPGAPRAPALASCTEAMGFAAWAGGRIPTAKELAALSANNVIPAEDRLQAEHVSDVFPLNPLKVGSFFDHEKWRENRDSMPHKWLRYGVRSVQAHMVPDIGFDDESLECGFRILYFEPSTDPQFSDKNPHEL